MDYATTLNIDQQGRIIIPAKVRKALQLHTGDVLMLEADTRNICLRKCDSHIPMDIRLDSFLDILHSNVPCRILLCNDSKIIASKNYHTALNMPVTESIQRLLQQGKMKLFSEKERIYPTMTGKYPISAFFPISKKNELGETLGLPAILSLISHSPQNVFPVKCHHSCDQYTHLKKPHVLPNHSHTVF